MNIPHISQAVLIAEDLLDQFRGVAAVLEDTGGAHVREAHDRAEADAFSLRIGEANRLYTGIWEHLDVAAAELAAAGRVVQQYQQVRREHGHLGVLDSTSETALALGPSLLTRKVTTQTKLAAQTNLHGAEHAERMCELLKAKLPEHDWDAARYAADEPPEDIRSKTHVYLGTALAAGLVAYIVYAIVS